MGLPPCEAGWQPHPHDKSSLVSTWGTPLIFHSNKEYPRKHLNRSPARLWEAYPADRRVAHVS